MSVGHHLWHSSAAGGMTMMEWRPRIRRSGGASLKRTAVAVVLGSCVTVVSFTAIVSADKPPTPQQVEFAERTSNLMLATLFAALLQEFAETTPANVEEGKHSISLIFNDRNDDMRLVGELQPLRENDVPQDSFEEAALARAMQGLNATALQKVEGKWFYRRSVAISNFHPACSMCHANFGAVDANQFVGALMLRVPMVGDNE
jgi:hypothetical protein